MKKTNKSKVNSIGFVDVKLNYTYGVHYVNVSSYDTYQINHHNTLNGKNRHAFCVDDASL